MTSKMIKINTAGLLTSPPGTVLNYQFLNMLISYKIKTLELIVSSQKFTVFGYREYLVQDYPMTMYTDDSIDIRLAAIDLEQQCNAQSLTNPFELIFICEKKKKTERLLAGIQSH